MKIAIIGLGYVGLPLGLRFAESDVSVLGLDIDQQKSMQSTRAKPISAILRRTTSQQQATGLLEASTDFARVAEVDADPDLRAHAAQQIPRAGHFLCPQVWRSHCAVPCSPQVVSAIKRLRASRITSQARRPRVPPPIPGTTDTRPASESSKLALVSKLASTFISRSPLSAKIRAAKITP